MAAGLNTISGLIVCGGVAIGLSVAGAANADPETCSGEVPGGGDHMPAYPDHRVPGNQDAECVTLHDVSSTGTGDDVSSWAPGDAVSSYPGHDYSMKHSPQ